MIIWAGSMSSLLQNSGWRGFPDGSDGKESACKARDPGLIPGSGRSSGGGHGNPIEYSCLENPMDRGAQWATVHGVSKGQTWLSNWYIHTPCHLYSRIQAERSSSTWKVPVVFQKERERAEPKDSSWAFLLGSAWVSQREARGPA